MTEDTAFRCPDCERTFDSGRALTQHARYVHEGATLFGQRLVDGSEELIDPDEEDRYWSDPNEDEGDSDAEGPEDVPSDLRLLTLVLGLGAIVLAIWLRTEPPSATGSSVEPPANSPFPEFGLRRGPQRA